MGRTLIGGSAVASSTTSSSTSSSTSSGANGRPERTRVQGLPLLVYMGKQSTSEYDPIGLEIVDSFGERCTTNGVNDVNAAAKISAYSTAQTSPHGYAGFNYLQGYYFGGNPSTSQWHGYNDYQTAAMHNRTSPLGNTYWRHGIDWDNNRPYYHRHAGQNAYGGGNPNELGGSCYMDSGSWIGPEGTRQEHSIISIHTDTRVTLIRNAGGETGESKDVRYMSRPRPDNTYAPDGFDAGVDKDTVDILEFVESGPTSDSAANNSGTGTRYCYNERLNMLVWVTGYSTYSSQSYVVTWTGASGKNLYDTNLRDWLTAATFHNHGLIQSGFTNMAANGGYNARVFLCDNKDLVIGWKQGNANKCYRITGLEDDNCVGVNMNIGGGTTSYDREQGNNYPGNSWTMSWDNKWIWFGCNYYYYHCGMQAIAFSVENPNLFFRYDESNTAYAWSIVPHGKSGFGVAHKQNMTGANGYQRVYDFGVSKAYYDADSTYHYGMREWNYANGDSGRTAYPGDRAAYPSDLASEYSMRNGLIIRTNMGTSAGNLDTTCSTWQGFNPRKDRLRVPTQDMHCATLDYWWTKVPFDDRDNSKDRY